jgi:Flp pilus assembly secretin CpaC
LLEEQPARSAATPALRASDVDFPSPPARNETEPLVAIGRPVSRTDYGQLGNSRAAQLRSMPPERFTFDRASLRDVLRFLAEAAGIPYIGIPEHAPQAQQLVTFRMTASPFAALESVARQNDIKLTYDDGVWFMRLRDANLERTLKAEDENELIGVVYQLRHDPADRIDFRASAGGAGFGGGANTSDSGSGGSIATPSLPLQNSQRVFQTKAPKIVNEIRVLLGMKPLQYAEDGSVTDPDASSGLEVARAPIPPYAGTVSAPAETQSTTSQTESASSMRVYFPPQKPQVVYNSDTNILWVVATRKQQKWVASYLQRVDKPQDLIAIEVKFFETRKNPQTDFGINWEGTFGGDGFVISGSAKADPSGLYTTRDSSETTTTSDRQTEFGAVKVDKTGRVSTDIDSRSLTTSTPFSAVLSTSQASVALQAFVKDRDSSLVQYPRVLTINNREVAITSAENTPVNAGVSTVQSGGTSSQPVGTLEYIPVGTQINILPKSVGKDQIALTVAITISQIVDFVPINLGTGSNDYPVTTQRVYNASLQVDSGYTLAVGGLEKVADRNSTGGIPVLKDIPGLGYLFKNKSRSRDRSNLIIFITPYLISDPSTTPGISEVPEAVIPLRPGVPPPAPNFTPEGSLLGGDAAIPAALRWLEFQLKYFTQINAESNGDAARISQLRNVIQRARSVANHLQTRVEEAGETVSPQQIEESQRADSLLLELNKVLASAQLDQFQLQQGFP